MRHWVFTLPPHLLHTPREGHMEKKKKKGGGGGGETEEDY